MTTKEDIINLVYKQKKNVSGRRYDPIYEILVFENPDKELIGDSGKKLGLPDMGATSYMGFYHTLEDAYVTIIDNICDIWEHCYDGAFLLCRFPGVYQSVGTLTRMYFIFNQETGKYEQKEEPEMFSCIGL